MSKKEFAWTTEVVIKTLEISEYELRVIRICTLNKKEYISFTTMKKIKGEFKPTGGYTLPKALWSQVSDAIDDYNMGEAFDTPADTKTALRAIENSGVRKSTQEKETTRKTAKK
jgi:hypothetical protein